MTTKEFITQIEQGNGVSRNDVITISEQFPDKHDLYWSFEFAKCRHDIRDQEWDQLDLAAQIIHCQYGSEIEAKDRILEQQHQKQQEANSQTPIQDTTPATYKALDRINNSRGIFTNPRVKKATEDALSKGFITENENGGLKWLVPQERPSHALLTYFYGYTLGMGEIYEGKNKNGNKQLMFRHTDTGFPESQLEDLFGIKNLRKSWNALHNSKLPRGHNIIDNLIQR